MSLKTMLFKGAKTVSNIVNNIPTPTVEDIHNEFDTAADKALAEAQAVIDAGFSERKRDLANKLEAAGFTSVGMVQSSNMEVNKVGESGHRAAIVLKYKEKYPQYKFIFKDQVEQICKKYGLICGKASQYIGNIPVKNIDEISNFKVNEEDIYWSPAGELRNAVKEKEAIEIKRREREDYRYPVSTLIWREPVIKIPFYICAPYKEMKIDMNQSVKNSFIEQNIPDPIVLHFVKDGFLIVSKWGEEAEDEMLKD